MARGRGSPNARQQTRVLKFKCLFAGNEQRLVDAEGKPGQCTNREGGVEGQRHGSKKTRGVIWYWSAEKE